MTEAIKDAEKGHWVYRMPVRWRPFLQLSRLDRPIGYWLLALPGWIGLAFAGLSHGLNWIDLKWAALISLAPLPCAGRAVTYNDIVDQDLDAKVERTALRPYSGRNGEHSAGLGLAFGGNVSSACSCF